MNRTSLMSLALVVACLAGQASAQQMTAANVTAQQRCYAEANTIDFSGEKAGYAAAYRAAVADCIDRGQLRYQGYNPPAVRARVNVIATNCPPDAPILYRGTLYCR